MKKSRQDSIFYGLPDALDLMVVCVEAGLGLDQAMRKVSEEIAQVPMEFLPKNSLFVIFSFRWVVHVTPCCMN